MSTLSDYIVELLGDDMVSHGLLVQCVEQGDIAAHTPPFSWQEVLKELLSSDVEIGAARRTSGDYVEFIAWKGSVDERVARANDAVESAKGADREFAYWLCLRKNVDRYEEPNGSAGSDTMNEEGR